MQCLDGSREGLRQWAGRSPAQPPWEGLLGRGAAQALPSCVAAWPPEGLRGSLAHSQEAAQALQLVEGPFLRGEGRWHGRRRPSSARSCTGVG